MEIHSSPTGRSVRGVSVRRQRASFGLRLGALIADLSLWLALFFTLHRAAGFTPVPEPWWPAAVIFGGGLAWGALRALAGRTAGERIWELDTEARGLPALAGPARRPDALTGAEKARAVLLTALAVVFCARAIDLAVFRQPIWTRAERTALDAYLPDLASGEWEVLPFFFTLGAWPRQFDGKPVFYGLPYEKGPPSRFVGHVVARWDEPGTQVTFEGPKTPDAPVSATPGEHTPRERIRDCLLGESHAWGCLKVREATLLRHLVDMQARLNAAAGRRSRPTDALHMRWRLRWFEVTNPAIPPAERAQGILISAQDEKDGEERYVLITENGTHQAIYLDYRLSSDGAALKTFEQAMRSLRAADDLGAGRAWIDRALENVALPSAASAGPAGSADPAADAATIGRLAKALALLTAKISVQPSIFDTYYHLGRIAGEVQRLARAPGNAGKLRGTELAAAARPLIQSAYRYAQDIAPQDAKTTLLQGIWLEAKKP